MQKFLTFQEYQEEVENLKQENHFTYNTVYRSYSGSSNWNHAYATYKEIIVNNGFDKDAIDRFFFNNDHWDALRKEEVLKFFIWDPETLPKEMINEIINRLEGYVQDQWLTTYSAIRCFPSGRPDKLLYTGSKKMCYEYDSKEVVVCLGTYSSNVYVDPETNKTHWS